MSGKQMLHFNLKKVRLCELVFRTKSCLVLSLLSCFTKLKPLENVFAQLLSVLPSVVRFPNCYVETKDVNRITAQPKENFCNHIFMSSSRILVWKTSQR